MKAKQEHVEKQDQISQNNNGISAIKTIDSSVFDNFKKLTDSGEQNRINAGLCLLQHFAKVRSEQKDSEKEFQYVLKRLIRGLGASTTISRAGFFTTFIGFLKLFLNSAFNVGTVLDVSKKQLHIGNTVSNKEDSDAVIGQILTCGALIRSDKLSGIQPDNLRSIAETLIWCSKHRSYHNSLSFSFIIELIENINEDQFTASVWPVIESELNVSWDKQTINTINCLIVARKRYPNTLSKKYFKSHFDGSQLLNPSSFSHLFKLFWENNSSISMITHPAYENFAIYITNCKYLEEFWQKIVDEKLSSSITAQATAKSHVNKLTEIKTLKILTDILQNTRNITDDGNDKSSVKVSNLLTENLMKMIITSLKNLKLKKDETLKAFYDDFFDVLNTHCSKLTGNDEDENEKIEIISKLILHPCTLSIEKYTSNRIIHQIITYLKENGIKKLFEIYKNIFLGTILKNPIDKNNVWLNIERQNAGYMLQTLINHKQIQSSLNWRTEQLKFIMKLSLFYTNKKGEVIVPSDKTNKDDEHADDGNGSKNRKTKSSKAALTLNNELSNQIKNIFYTSLQFKVIKLEDQRKILIELIDACNEVLQKKNFNLYLKDKINNDEILKIWNDMYSEVHKKESLFKSKKQENDNKLEQVFHILLLHMGLQLFKEPDMAKSGILDLKRCLHKSKSKLNREDQKAAKQLKKTKGENENDDELEWIEVVIDLFLHLLSQNVNALRIVVNSVFPHLCDKLTLSALHQILSVLDMTDGNNPLEDDENVDNDDSDDGKPQANGINNSHDDDDHKSSSNSSSDESGDEEEEDDDDDEILGEEEEEEESTITDRLRNAVSTALNSVISNQDDDQDSIALDDMDEEEGKRLDEALSNAFRAIKNDENTNKKSRVYRIKTTTLMHFRIRVLDLIEIYIQNNHQPKMLYVIEIMLTLYNMIEHCTEKELKPLTMKLNKILSKLTSVRHFSLDHHENNDDIVTNKNICDYLRLIIEKKVGASISEIHNKFKAKCCIFLINCGKILYEKHSSTLSSVTTLQQNRNEYIDEILNLLEEYLNDFIKSRNPVITITLLNDIFKMRWYGIWQLTKILIQNGLNDTTRTFRRIQILELLEQLYNNYEFIRQDLKLAKKELKIIETYLQNFVSLLSQKSSSSELSQSFSAISVREFSTILNVFYSMNKCHNKCLSNSNLNNLYKDKLCESIQNIRRNIKIDNGHNYTRFCTIFGIKPLKNSEVVAKVTLNSNNHINENDENGGEIISDDDDDNEGKNKEKHKKKRNKNEKQVIQTNGTEPSMNSNGNDNFSGDKVLKRKNNSYNDFRKEKKLKKEERLRIASEGFNDKFSFKSVNEIIDD